MKEPKEMIRRWLNHRPYQLAAPLIAVGLIGWNYRPCLAVMFVGCSIVVVDYFRNPTES